MILETSIFKTPAHIIAKCAFSWIDYNKRTLIEGILRTDVEILALLDVGGVGYSQYLLRKSPCCHLLVGVNISREAMRHAKRELTTHVDYVVADAHTLPFKKLSFSLTFAKDLLHHVKNPVKILKELKEITKGEVVIVEANRPNSLMLFWTKYGNHQHFTLDQIVNLVSKAGMKLRDYKQLHVYPFSLLFWPIKAPVMVLWNFLLVLFLFSSYIIPWLPEIGLNLLSLILKPSFNVIYASGYARAPRYYSNSS